MSLLDSADWTGRVWSAGWVEADGGERAVVEPATGAELGRVGIGAPSDIARACAGAAEAQQHWAAVSFEERAAAVSYTHLRAHET